MKKTSCKKNDFHETLRIRNQSNGSTSPRKGSITRDNTCVNFQKEKGYLQLPKIYPLLNLMRKKRYPENSSHNEEALMNLIGTRCNVKMSIEKKNVGETSGQEPKRDRPLLDRQQTQKQLYLEAILANNGLSRISFAKKEKIKAFIDEGNNSRLIKELMRKRTNIQIVFKREEANFLWTQFCDWQSSNIPSIFSEPRKTSRLSTPVSRGSNLSREALTRTDTSSNNVRLRELMVSKIFVHNHLRSHYEISDKKSLFKNIKKYCLREKMNQSEIIPLTYHVDHNFSSIPEDICKQKDIWIVKPGEDTNRGTGISVQIGRDNILKAVRQLAVGSKTALVQEYIEPLLYKNRKFDIRCYALVTSYAGVLKAYWYHQGYLRTCSKEFNYDPGNIYGHLTNDAVQKKCKQYGKYEPCNKLSFSDLQSLLRSKQFSYEAVVNRMKALAKISIKSVEDKLRSENNIFGFEIFGYDFLIDQAGKVWLIEINTNPCLEFAGSLLARIIWHMVENSLAIALDPLLNGLPETYNSWRDKNDKIYEDSKFQCII